MTGILAEQKRHWDEMFRRHCDMFGRRASAPARWTAGLCKRAGIKTILELGGGQGRDTLFFARQGFSVTVLDYAASGIDQLKAACARAGLAGMVTALCHDIRAPLPFADGAFAACYSHMLFCMALTEAELRAAFAEARRVLCPGGLHVYTVRNTSDPHYAKGSHRGEGMYEMDGFIVHFFSRALVEELAAGCEIVSVDEFEEGELPRRLFRVVLRKT